MIAHQTDLMRVEAGLQAELKKSFRGLADELTALVKSIDPTDVTRNSARQARLIKLVGGSKPVIDATYRGMKRQLTADMKKLIKIEQEAILSGINTTVGIELANKRLGKEALEAIAGNILVQGGTVAEWGKSLSATAQQQFANEMRMGMLAGENLNDLLRRVRGRRENGFKDGFVERASRNAEKIVRTALAEVNGKARLDVLQNNADVMDAAEWSSTLDNRTSEICMHLSGQSWDINTLEPIGDSGPFPGHPPAHFNCRSDLIPVLKPLGELSENPRIRKKLSKTRYESWTRASGWKDPDTGKVTGKVVSGRMTYDDWLNSLSEAKQRQVLGAGRYDLWKAGKITSVRQLANQAHRPYTVAQLQDKYGIVEKSKPPPRGK